MRLPSITARSMLSRLILTAGLAIVCSWAWAPSARAVSDIDAIVDQLYRGSPFTSVSCGSSCQSLWSKEQSSTNIPLQKDLGNLRAKLGLFGLTAQERLLRQAIGCLPLGPNRTTDWVRFDGPRRMMMPWRVPVPMYVPSARYPGAYEAWENICFNPDLEDWTGRYKDVTLPPPGQISGPPYQDGWAYPPCRPDGAYVPPESEYLIRKVARDGSQCSDPFEGSWEAGYAVPRNVAQVGPIRDWDGRGVVNIVGTSASEAPPRETTKTRLCNELAAGSYPAAAAWYGEACDQPIALRFRPLLLFDSSEKWRPLNVTRFFAERNSQNTPLHFGCNGIGTCTLLNSTEDLATRAFDDAYIRVNAAADTSADVNDPERYSSPYPACNVAGLKDCDSGDNSALYYHISPLSPTGYRYVDYWFFYRYNKFGSNPITDNFNHQGDWEGVTVAPSILNPATFDFVSFSGHGTYYSYLRGTLSCDVPTGSVSCGDGSGPFGARVVSFVANGSHANYPRRCAELIDLVSCSQPDGRPERGFDGSRGWGRNLEEGSALLRFPDAADPDFTGYNWVDWPGTWGDPAAGGGAPASPGRQPHFVTPSSAECGEPGCAREARANDGRDRGRSRRSGATAAVRARCGTWFGPPVQALVCAPATLKVALRKRSLGRQASVTFEPTTTTARAASRKERSAAAPASRRG